METWGGMISVNTGVRSGLECKGTSSDLLGSAELGLASLLLPALVSSDVEGWLVACSWERFGGGFFLLEYPPYCLGLVDRILAFFLGFSGLFLLF